MTQHLLITKKPRQRGVTLIEVLISVFIISFAVVGAAALQVNSLKNSMAMEYRAQASFLANDMFERMRAVRRLDSQFNLTRYAVADTSVLESLPNSNTIQGSDLREWATFIATTLPSGRAEVVAPVANPNSVRLIFTWQQNSPYAPNGAANEQITFVVEAVI